MTSLGRCHWFEDSTEYYNRKADGSLLDSLTRNVAFLLRLVHWLVAIGLVSHNALVLLQQPQLVPAFGPMDRC